MIGSFIGVRVSESRKNKLKKKDGEMIAWQPGSEWITQRLMMKRIDVMTFFFGFHRIPFHVEVYRLLFFLLGYKKKLTGHGRSPRGKDMESKDKKVELLQIAIKQLIEEEKARSVKRSSCSDDDDESFLAVCNDGDDADDHLLLSRLLSQVSPFLHQFVELFS